MRKRSEIVGKKPETPPPARTPGTNTIACAKCGLEQPGGTSDCLACGATLPEFKVNVGEPQKNAPPEPENLGKLAFDLKNKNVDITLAQLAAIVPDDRRELQKWVDAKSPDVLPRVRMILERLNELKVKPLAGPEAREDHDVFTIGGNVMDLGPARSTVLRDSADEGEEVVYTLGKEMYRVAEFCTFDVGPYSATTRIRKGETRAEALMRLRQELEAVAVVDRTVRRKSTIDTLLGIKPALTKASESRKE